MKMMRKMMRFMNIKTSMVALAAAFVITISCDDEFLDVYSTEQIDKNGYYHYPYTGFNYGSIYFETTPMTLVGWTSPDEFCIQFFDELICEPVINYQTYSREDGSGQQNFYMSEEFIGDTLNLVGYLNTEIVTEIKVIIE